MPHHFSISSKFEKVTHKTIQALGGDNLVKSIRPSVPEMYLGHKFA